MLFKFALLDPRPIQTAEEANAKVFASGSVLGIEVTVPALGARCVLGNIDPQHTGGDASRAAIEVVAGGADYRVFCDYDGGPRTVVLATVRADLDAVGAMAVLSLRAKGESLEEPVGERVAAIAASDKFVRGAWAPRLLPSRSDPWAGEFRQLAAMVAVVSDHKIPIAERVAAVERWLLTGEEPDSYRAQVERERLDLVAALESGVIRAEDRGGVAVVETTNRSATSVGYSLAPVVVALNPSFKLGGGEPHRKFTVCAYGPQHADIRAALAELSELELGWGGSPTIGGSPQGVSSTLTLEQVTEVVQHHLR